MEDKQKRELVYEELTALYAKGGALAEAPPSLMDYFDEVELVKVARELMRHETPAERGKAIIVTAGAPGAGKSRVLDDFDLSGYRRIDPDAIKDTLLEAAEKQGLLQYRNGLQLPDGAGVHLRELGSHVHRFSTIVSDLMRAASLDRGENIVVDGSLAWEPLAQRYVDELLDAGYEAADVVSVEVTEEMALERAQARWWSGRLQGEPGGRFVPAAVVQACFDEGHSKCALNAEALATQVQDELGAGTLVRYGVHPRTGVPTQINY